MLLTGLALAMHLPVAPAWRLLIIVVWIADVLRELASLISGTARVRLLRLTECGQIVAEGPDGRLESLTLLNGSVVGRRIAWLRLRFADNQTYAELLCGNGDEDQQWQRLQLIWQQSRHAFGESG